MKMNGNMAEHLLPKLVPMDEYNYLKAKQRASITWLLTKVYNNRVPEELRDPYYRDHNDKECLKPNIIHALANAEYYCLALANIYIDQNYHHLNHWGVIQALARKGVYVAEPSDVALTETVLIQTTPIKLSAHMAVIEAIMMLYIKEMITPERIVNCIQRISSLNQSQILPVDPEEALLLWINKCVDKLRLNIEKELESSPENRESVIPPVFHKAQDLSDLTDGVLLCSVISLYCPLELEWTEIAFGDPMILSDSVYNLQLVVQFCEEYMPSHLSFVSIEDILYMHSSVKQNIVTFIAELFSAFEINTIKCVTMPTNDDNKYPFYGGKRPRTGTPSKTPKRNSQQNTSVPDLRSGYLQSSSLSELNRLGNNSNSSQKSPSEKSVPVTIKRHNSVQERDQNRRKIFGSSEGFKTVGSPGGYEDNYDFRGRRNDSLNDYRSFDDTASEFVVHRGRSIPTLSTVPSYDDSVNYRSRASRDKFSDTRSEDRGELRRRGSMSSLCGDEVPAAGKPTTFSDSRPGRRSRRNSVSDDSQLTIENFGGSQDNLHLLCRNPDKEPFAVSGRLTADVKITDQFTTSHFSESRPESPPDVVAPVYAPSHHSEDNDAEHVDDTQVYSMIACDIPGNKATSFAELSKLKDSLSGKGGINIVYMTQEKPSSEKKSFLGKGGGRGEQKSTSALPNSTTWQQQSLRSQQQNASKHSPEPSSVAADLSHVRLQLEEKRKLIETEKKKVEVHMNKQRQKMGKQAFLQAVSKEINDDVHSLQNKWLNRRELEEKRTPDLENLDYEQYHNSLQQMTSSLNDLQSDIQKISAQQQQVQEMLKNASGRYDDRHDAQQMGPDYGQPYHSNASYSPYARRQWGNINMEPTFAQQNYPPAQAWQSPRRDKFTDRPIGDREIEPEGFKLHATQSLQSYGTPPQSAYSNGAPYEDYSSYQSNSQPPRQYFENRAPFRLHESVESNRSPGTAQRFYSNLPEKAYSDPGEHVGPLSYRKASKPVDVPIMGTSPQSAHKGVIHAPLPVPTENEMEPQDVSFIECSEESSVPELESKLSNFNIRSGSRTYRIPNNEPGSPPRPMIGRTFKVPKVIPSPTSHDPHEDFHNHNARRGGPDVGDDEGIGKTASLKDGLDSDKGFYISFDDAPKRPKPQLKPRKNKQLGSENRSPSKADRKDPQLSKHPSSRDLNVSSFSDYPLSKDIVNFDTKPSEPSSKSPFNKSSDRSIETVSPKSNKKNVGLVVGNELNPQSVEEMEKKKELILLLSLKRKEEQEEARRKKQAELQERQETERRKEEEKLRKKEEEKARREAILQQHRIKKAREQAEKEGRSYDGRDSRSTTPIAPNRTRHKSNSKQRPKSLHESQLHRADHNGGYLSRRGSEYGESKLSPTKRHSRYGSAASLSGMSSRRGSISNLHSGISDTVDSYGHRYDTDSGLGRATPPRRAQSPGNRGRYQLSPSGPPSLPHGLIGKRRGFDDGASDVSSTASSSYADYCGPRLYKQPTAKSNRPIILNAVQYCVFPGAVNAEAKNRVLEEIKKTDCKHLLILFRDAKCQFRGLYSYNPETEEVYKLYGTGPKHIDERMYDRFFKYNSGGKCFSQIHTKHLSVTIDAFTIHGSLWQGKKVSLPNKKDLTLVV